MKRVILILLLVLANVLIAGELKKLSFEQAYLNKGEKLLKRMPRVFGWADADHYYELKDMQLLKVDARSGKSQPAQDSSKYKALFGQGLNPMTASDRSSDYGKMLFVKKGDIFFFNAADGKVIQITKTEGTEENPTFSPDGTKIGYTMGGNLYVYDTVGKKSKQLTNDGSDDILNGYASWVYYEEILGRRGKYRAFWWSPDSGKLVFMRFDQAKVPVFSIFNATGDYGQLEKQRYPKPGYPNPEVKIGTVDVNSGNVEWIPFEDKNEHYLAFPRWNDKSDTVYFQWLNRDQNHLKIVRCEPAVKNMTTLYEEKQKAWIDFLEDGDLKILSKGNLLIRSSQSGWYHIYFVSSTVASR
jgi:dipeptidyl-peptidase-4